MLTHYLRHFGLENPGMEKMTDTKAEIARVEKALAETTSPYLKRDYEKYLRKLRKRLSATNGQ